MSLSTLEFDVLAEHLGVDPLPLVLRVPSPGRTDVERRGLGRPVAPDPRAVRLLGLRARPDHEVDARLWHGGEVRALAAATGDDAVLAVLRDGVVSPREADATGLARHVLSTVPPLGAGPGLSVTLPTEDFRAASSAPEPEFAKTSRARGIRSTDADLLGEMIGPVLGHGHLGTAARDKWGARKRTPGVLSYFDTEAGRYFQTQRPAPDGVAWTTIAPATPRTLLHLLHSVVTVLPA
ncbi:ESX secretion-associated protein EspG [Actinokineospora pegani]|uniref:ESX secretion-associated protein EspG n=1 Tax=Actinokineospora pegani TaxID=2654637 RepID=UPI001F24A559|nr:ESX secretion-associated protein EspG [Actinokineospora pegani]